MIDEKGRLFGKINIVDALALLLVIAAAVVLCSRMFFSPKKETPKDQCQLLTYTTRVMGVEEAMYEDVLRYVNKNLGLRDQLMAGAELLPGFIVDVTATDHVPSPMEVDRHTLDLVFTVEAEVAVKDVMLNRVGSQEVRTGKGHILKSQHFEFTNGLILSCEWGAPQDEPIFNLEPEDAEDAENTNH